MKNFVGYIAAFTIADSISLSEVIFLDFACFSSAKKCKRGDPLGFINIYSVAKYQKTRKGDSFEKLKIFEKSHNAKKN